MHLELVQGGGGTSRKEIRSLLHCHADWMSIDLEFYDSPAFSGTRKVSQTLPDKEWGVLRWKSGLFLVESPG